jgi:HPr kinase/phosphorylase
MASSAGHTPAPPDAIVHASAIAIDGRAALLTGASGSGKSTLALQAIGLGAGLISDDRTALRRTGGLLMAAPAPHIAGMIEVRGVGLLRAPVATETPVALLVDLDLPETERLPPWRVGTLLDLELPCLHKIEGPHFPAAIVHYLKYGRVE